jgi:hypothetical protein
MACYLIILSMGRGLPRPQPLFLKSYGQTTIVRHHQNNILTLTPIFTTPAFPDFWVFLTQGKNGCQGVIYTQNIPVKSK